MNPLNEYLQFLRFIFNISVNPNVFVLHERAKTKRGSLARTDPIKRVLEVSWRPKEELKLYLNTSAATKTYDLQKTKGDACYA